MPVSHDGSMVLLYIYIYLYMVTWIPSISPSHVSIYTIYQHHGSVMGVWIPKSPWTCSISDQPTIVQWLIIVLNDNIVKTHINKHWCDLTTIWYKHCLLILITFNKHINNTNRHVLVFHSQPCINIKPWWNLILGNPMRAKVTCFNSGVTFSAAAAWYHLVPYDMGILVEHGMGILGDWFTMMKTILLWVKSLVLSLVLFAGIHQKFYSFTWPTYHVLSPIFCIFLNPDPSAFGNRTSPYGSITDL